MERELTSCWEKLLIWMARYNLFISGGLVAPLIFILGLGFKSYFCFWCGYLFGAMIYAGAILIRRK